MTKMGGAVLITTLEYENANYRDGYAAEIGVIFDDARTHFSNILELIAEIRDSTTPCASLTKAVILSNALDGVFLYRSIIGVCEIGQNQSAEILTRSLFEIYLAQRSILKPPVAEIKAPAIPAGENPTDFVAKVYFYAGVLKHGRSVAAAIE